MDGQNQSHNPLRSILHGVIIIILYIIYIGIRPVEDLLFNISVNESARVLWNLPSFVADDVINLSYQVIMTDNNTIVVDDTLNDREYEVSIDILSLCSIYTVTVTAFDEKYTSDSSIIQEGYTGGNYLSIEVWCHILLLLISQQNILHPLLKNIFMLKKVVTLWLSLKSWYVLK